MTFKERLIKFSKTALMIWGGLSFVGVIVIACYLLYSFGAGNKDVDEQASKSDVRFVLNWCELGDQRIEKVLHSHVSARSLTGDHLDAYAIKITDVSVDELTKVGRVGNNRWYRCDSLPKILDDAVSFVGGWQHENPWFPTEESIRTTDFYVYTMSIYTHGVTPSAAELIFIKPADKMVYFVSAKM